MKYLLSPNFWIGVFSVSAILGIAFLLAATFFEIPWLGKLGLALGAPLVLGGILAVCVGIPVLLIANRKK